MQFQIDAGVLNPRSVPRVLSEQRGAVSLWLLMALLNARLLAKSALFADSVPDMADLPTDPDLVNALTNAGWLLEQTVR